jgi:phosphopantothenoylcysteine decarboxylase/phosphopantothenate--cysteine ligase
VKQKRILLIIGGGIAAYKCLDLVRRAREQNIAVRAVMTRAAAEFITPLSVGALTNDRVFTDLFDLSDEREIGHIRLSREADLVIVAPATADLLAKMTGGHADDLASTVLMATDKPVLVAPAMNPHMWWHPATRRNVEQLKADGIHFVGPNVGEMAERDETGEGRLAEVPEIIAVAASLLAKNNAARSGTTLRTRPALTGRHVLVTSGPTYEPIDPVRFIANRSTGKQGHAVAKAAFALGARVTLVTGPVGLPKPKGVDTLDVETAQQMLDAVHDSLPADVAVFVAAVADWRAADVSREKIKKTGKRPAIDLVENPDILATVAKLGLERPPLVIGFAAETEDVIGYAKKKLKTKGADWIAANDVSPETHVFGSDTNTVHLVTLADVENWPQMTKEEVAERLMLRAAEHLLKSKAAAE